MKTNKIFKNIFFRKRCFLIIAFMSCVVMETALQAADAAVGDSTQAAPRLMAGGIAGLRDVNGEVPKTRAAAAADVANFTPVPEFVQVAEADQPAPNKFTDTLQTASADQPAAGRLKPSATLAAAAQTGPAGSVVVNLIKRLVQRGLLTKEDSDDLMKQAIMDAEAARAQAATATAQATPAPAPEGVMRVTYVPEVVKSQIRDEIKQEVMQQARDENWAAPHQLPSWVSRFSFNGDVRLRYEGDYFPTGNDTAAGLTNFNSINTSTTPIDTATPFPFYNMDQDRERMRLRARFGADVNLGQGFSSGVRLATGDTSSPVTQNQTFGGTTNGSGGNFSKYAIWLDRGFIKYELGGLDKSLMLNAGRIDNPFFSTSMIWADDLGFDGVVAAGKYQVADGVKPFLTGGAFPVYNTDFNFASNQGNKFKSEDKWLFGVQSGVDWKINKDFSLKLAGAFYDYENIEGKVSTPFVATSTANAGDTDGSRPSFAQKGNTYIKLRNLLPGSTADYQYYGLATPFRIATLTGRLDYSRFDPLHIALVGEFAKNVAFDRASIISNGPGGAGPVNNVDANNSFVGGDTAWIVSLNLGKVALEKLWDWNTNIGYRYVESDAVVDGFCDSDFGGGGTNLKGLTIGGNMALSPRVSTGMRWMSADSVAGPKYSEDVFQFDIKAKF